MDKNPPTPDLCHVVRVVAIFLVGAALQACGSGDDGGGPPPVLTANSGCDYAGLGQSLTGTVSGSDPDGRSLTYTIAEGPKKGQVSLDKFTGAFTYTPAPGNAPRRTDSFAFRVNNGQNNSGPATFRIVFTPRIMPLGDSITLGITVGGSPGSPPPGQRVGYRKPLRDDLSSAGYRIDYVGTLVSGGDSGFLGGDAQHDGHGGWTAGQLVNGHPSPDPGTGSGRLADWLNVARPDVVLLHIGTNDLNAPGDNSGLWVDVERILDAIDAWEGGNWPVTVIVARIIDTRSGRAETTNYNDNVVNLALRRKQSGDQVIWVNHESALNAAGDYADELHPSAAGYQKMANVWMYPLAGTGNATGNHSGAGVLPRCP